MEKRTHPTLCFDQGTLVLSLPSGAETPGKPFTWDARVGRWRTAAVHYALLGPGLLERYPELEDQVPQPASVRFSEAELPTLRPEQEKALRCWQEAGRRGMVIMPTGTGKTVVALAAMAEACVSTLIVAPVRDLMYQWHQRIQATLGIDAGIIGDAFYTLRPITVTTYDSAYIHMHDIGDRFGLIIFDEAHHLPGKQRREVALLSAAPFRLGLTATPERSDEAHRDFDHLIGPEVYRQGVDEARGRTLAHYEVVRIPVALKDVEQKIYDDSTRLITTFMAEKREKDPMFEWRNLSAAVGTDPQARAVQKAYFRKTSIEDRAEEKLRVLEDIFRLHLGERVLVFTGSNAMALDVSKRFLIPTILSHTRKKERLAVLGGFAENTFPALVANQVLDEGVDIPSVKVAVILGGHASTRQTKQRLGRILRPHGGVNATLYEVFCAATKEVTRSRARRRSDAFAGAKQIHIAEGESILYGRKAAGRRKKKLVDDREASDADW